MILDLLDQVMSSYAPTATTTTFQNYIDRKVAMENAAGFALDVYINVAAAVTSAGAATVQFQAIGNASDPTFASGNVVLFDSGVIAKAALVAGYQCRGTIKRVDMVSLEPTTSFLRYLTITSTIGTAVLTAGTFNAWFKEGEAIQDNLSYPAGYTV